MTKLENSRTLRLRCKNPDGCCKEGWTPRATQEAGEKLSPEAARGWGAQGGTHRNRTIDSGRSSGLQEMMNLLAHSLGNSVHFKAKQTTASLSTSLTWFAGGNH